MKRTLRNAPKKPGEGFDPDVGQGVVALHGDQRAGGQRQKSDDDHRAADDGECPGPHPQDGDQPQHLTRITPDRVDGGAERVADKRRLLPQAADRVDHPAHDLGAGYVPLIFGGTHGDTFTPKAVARMLIRNRAMKANTTVSLTALPTAVGPPPTDRPL